MSSSFVGEEEEEEELFLWVVVVPSLFSLVWLVLLFDDSLGLGRFFRDLATVELEGAGFSMMVVGRC
jgi:hypothetical protein